MLRGLHDAAGVGNAEPLRQHRARQGVVRVVGHEPHQHQVEALVFRDRGEGLATPSESVFSSASSQT